MITRIYQDHMIIMFVTSLYSTIKFSTESKFFCDETDTREYLALRYIMWLSSLREKRIMRNSGRGLK